MKKTIFFLLLIASVISYGQETTVQSDKNRTEIKLNLYSLSNEAIDFEFERTINSRSSFGLSFFSSLKEDNSIGYEKHVSAFYRYYIGEKYASGFFVEGFGMYNSIDYVSSVSASPPLFEIKKGYNSVNDFALGLGVGYKWVSEKGIILQANLSIGRNLFNHDLGEEVVGKIGVSIGYGF